MERVGYRNPFRRIPLAGSVLVAPRPIDWNADGRMDLLLADPSGNVRLFLQNEEGEPQLSLGLFHFRGIDGGGCPVYKPESLRTTSSV